ncbi:MAG: amidohydrolase family protein [Planctomycetales bacterium]|jgi:imidazolonepropionase-like amidohydrolase
MKHLITILVFAVLSGTLTASDAIPGAPQKGPIVIIGATIHTVSGPVIDKGDLLFHRGRIVALGESGSVKIPDNAERVNGKGRHVYPGLFEAHSHLGLVEVSAVRASRDQSESGQLNPNVRAHVSVNPDSELIPVTRANGVLLALTAPSGGRIAGQAAVMQLDGWTFEDMTVRPGAAMVVSWPSVPNHLETKDAKKDPVALLRDLFDESRAYLAARTDDPSTQQTDLKLESMRPVFERKMPLLVSANSLAVIQSAVAFAVEQNIRLIIIGGYDAPLCAELLKKHKVPVIVSAVYRLPRRRSDGFDVAYTLPARLREAGILFCISGSGSSRVSNTRNLPYHAATAVAYGLPADEALKAITLYPAQILGVAKRVGSLERGKDATLIMTTGDPLETSTQVTSAWIRGRAVDLSSRHTQLYEKYREKYRRLEK